MQVKDKFMPYIAVLSPILCGLMDYLFTRYLHYSFGYEILIINGLLTFTGMWIFRKKNIIFNTIKS